MKRISSATTVFHKKIFPLIWFGFLALFVAAALAGGAVREVEWMALLVPCFLAVAGFVVMKKFVWDLVDEVHDCGDSLRVKNGAEEETIPLTNILNVSATSMINPPRITLRLVTPGRFGREVSFSPVSTFSLNPFARNAVADDLIVRVDKARSRRAV